MEIHLEAARGRVVIDEPHEWRPAHAVVIIGSGDLAHPPGSGRVVPPQPSLRRRRESGGRLRLVEPPRWGLLTFSDSHH